MIRQEAAGFGTVYFTARMLEHQGETMEGKRLAVSGFGNMSWGVCRKSAELGGKVVTLSGPDGYVYDPDGITTQEKFRLHALHACRRRRTGWRPMPTASAWSSTPARSPWEVPVDIAMPCATQNELDVEDAVMLVANNVRYYVEAANMPPPRRALKLLRLSPRILTAGSQGLRLRRRGGLRAGDGPEQRALQLVPKEVDDRLRSINMNNIYDLSAAAAAEYDLGYDDLIAGNDIAAFKKISTAMIAQGL